MTRPRRVVVYRDAEGRWRWRLVAGNGRVVGRSEQGFASSGYARRDAERDNAGLGEWRGCEVGWVAFVTRQEAE